MIGAQRCLRVLRRGTLSRKGGGGVRRTLHLVGRVGDGKDGEGHAVFEHLLHLLGLEGVVPPHEVRLEDVVDASGVDKGLVGGEEEAVAVPGARVALGLELADDAALGTHLGLVDDDAGV